MLKIKPITPAANKMVMYILKNFEAFARRFLK